MEHNNMNKKLKLGGVSFESGRNAYRGTVTINRVRLKTKRYSTRLGAKRALNKLIREMTNN
jgi:hypothetical protein